MRDREINNESTRPIDRRAFLAAASVAPLALGLGQPSAGSDRAENRPADGLIRRTGPRPATPPANQSPAVRKALKFGMIQEGASIGDKLKIARDAGFEGVEFDAPTELDTDAILRAKEEAGIEIPGVVDAVHWSKPLSDPDPRVRLAGRHALEQALHTCKVLGGTQVLLVPAVVNERVSYADAYQRSITELRRVMPVAQELGVRIAIENVWNNFLLSPLEVVGYLNEILPLADNRLFPSDDGVHRLLGWYFDIGNIWHYAWPRHWLDALHGNGLHLVSRLDLKGYSRAKSDKEGRWAGFQTEIGEGDIPWATVRDWIRDTRWTGWATAEVRGGDRARLTDIATRMDRVLGLADTNHD